MLINRCDHIDDESRMQCNQEAYAKFEGSRQQLCKLHTFLTLNQLDDESIVDTIGPITVINEIDKDDLSVLLESIKLRFHPPESDVIENPEPKVESAPVEKGEGNEGEKNSNEETAQNRSDVTENEVKD